MKKNSFVTFFYLIFIIISIIAQLVYIPVCPASLIPGSLLSVFTLFFAVFYSIENYKKQAAPYFKTYMILFAVSELATFIGLSYMNFTNAELSVSGTVFDVVSNVLAIVGIFGSLIIGLSKDLGEKESNTICKVVFILYAIGMVIFVVELGKMNQLSFALRFLSRLMMAAIMWTMVYMKYENKRRRGTK